MKFILKIDVSGTTAEMQNDEVLEVFDSAQRPADRRAIVEALLTRLTNTHDALKYDLRDLSASERVFSGGAERLWRANMAAWKALQGR